MRSLLHGAAVDIDHAIAPGVKLRILLLIFGMGENITDRIADSLIKADGCVEARNKALDFAVVKYYGVCLDRKSVV